MVVVWMALSSISLGLFGNFILESTRMGGNTQLYVPAWLCFALGLLFALFAYLWQRKEVREQKSERQAKEDREIAREGRDKKRFEEEKKMWQEVQLIIPKKENSKDELNQRDIQEPT